MTDKRPLPLKHGIERLFAEARLDAAQLAQLRALQEPARPDRRRLVAVAAAVCVSAGTGFLVASELGGAPVAPLQRLADEIAYNHLHYRRLDVQADSLEALRPAFASLGFRLSEQHEQESVTGQLQGGRFCSLASVPAALLRYEHPQRDASTVYQAPFDARRHGPVPDKDQGVPPALRHARGVSIRIWRSDGLLFAVATTDPSSTSPSTGADP